MMLAAAAAAIIRPVQILIVGQQSVRLCTKEVAIPVEVKVLHIFQFEVMHIIPDAEEGKDDRKIGF